MSLSRRFSAWVALVALSLAPAASLRAATDPAPSVIAAINSVIDLVLGQSPETISQRIPEIRNRMKGAFDVDAIVQRAFGGNWKKLTPAQQKEAIELLGSVIIRTFATQLATGSRPTLTVVSSKEIAPERREIVTTASQDGKTANIVYRLAPLNGSYKVYDVLAENVSVVNNYRQQFDAHFQKKSADDLLQVLREKLRAPAVDGKTK